MKQAVLSGIIVAALVTPALADEFYVVHDPATKHCSIVSEKPTTTTTTIIGDKAFKTSNRS